MVLCYTMIVLKLYCSASPGERGGKPPQQVHTEAHPIHRVCHDDNENDGCANEKEINRFLLFSVSCKAESGETGHRGHRCIFPLLVRAHHHHRAHPHLRAHPHSHTHGYLDQGLHTRS